MTSVQSHPQIWELLGQGERVNRVTQSLLSGELQQALIVGPPGCGKSWLARSIAATFVKGGGVALRGAGDEAEANRRLYAFQCVRAETSGLMGPLAEAGFIVANVLTKVATGGLLDAQTARPAFSAEAARRKRSVLFLNADEQAVLSDIEQNVFEKPALLVADNIHWWDKDSLSLLKAILDRRVDKAYPYTNQMRILAVTTESAFQKPVWIETYERSILPFFSETIQLDYLETALIRDSLLALAVGHTLAQPELETMFTLSGGHLSIFTNGCAYLERQGGVLTDLAPEDKQAFLDTLFMERVRRIPDFSQDAKAVLDAAAVIGAVSRRDELDCLLRNQNTSVDEAIDACRRLEFLDDHGDRVEFRHDFIKRFFATRLGAREADLRRAFAECLRQLSPGEYMRRADNLSRSGDRKFAAELFVVAAIESLRSGKPPLYLMSEAAIAVVTDVGYTALLADFESAYRAFSEGRSAEALIILEGLGAAYPTRILAEIEFLRSQIDLNSRSTQRRQQAISRLKAWSDYRETEVEQGVRLLVLLRSALILEFDKAPVRHLDQDLTHFLSTRIYFDPDAERIIHSLDRSAEGLFLSDIAMRRIERAEKFHRPLAGMPPLDPAEYFRCLNNLASSKLSNNDVSLSIDLCQQALALSDQFSESVFPRRDLTATIYTLARFRRGDINAMEAAQEQLSVTRNYGNFDDPYYPENHRAVYLCLDGRLDNGIEILETLLAKILGLGDPEPSPHYFVASNLWSARFLNGADPCECLEAWQALKSIVDRIPYETRSLLQRRHGILNDAIADRRVMSPTAWDTYPFEANPVPMHPCWTEVGRGFRIPDPQFWSLY